MELITARKENEYPFLIRLIFWLQKRKYGKPLESGKLWARVPRLFWGVSMLYGALDRKKSPINPELRALITVRVSQVNNCAFCVDINSALVLERGGSMDKLKELDHFAESEKFSPREKAALNYAEAITYTDRKIDANIYNALKQHFEADAIVELTGLIAFQNLSSKFNNALDILPQGFCNILASQPTGK